ncbi:HNH endonuclease [Candidatus Palauibacter sp.]|uniref:HNH endonuclease n=1 Tax=Candidatus Palauibacter sp. TaxID=3101350 RepID=UPI003C6F9F11
MKPQTDRGQTRQFAAQLFIILDAYESDYKFADFNKPAIDQCYYDNMELDEHLATKERLVHILDELYKRLSSWDGPKLPKHLIIHLVLMWHQFESKFVDRWRQDVAENVREFMREVAEGQKRFRDGEVTESYSGYGSLTRSNADRGDTIRRRHRFFMEWMKPRLQLIPKDPKRSFDLWEREYVYLSFNGRCAYWDNPEVCGDDSRMAFKEAEVHHVEPHSEGGKTDFENGVLVHRGCHGKIGTKVIPVTGRGAVGGGQ